MHETNIPSPNIASISSSTRSLALRVHANETVGIQLGAKLYRKNGHKSEY